jgi:hypothetical protein
VKPLRAVLNIVGLVICPAAAAGTAAFVLLEWLHRWAASHHDQLDRDLTSELRSWFPTPEAAP